MEELNRIQAQDEGRKTFWWLRGKQSAAAIWRSYPQLFR